MELLLLGIYSFFVWLIFIKLKWLPWNTATQVTVVIIPVVGLAALILLLNIFAPSSSDVRVYKYTIPIVSQVKGRVIEVAVEEGNRLVKKGDILFRVDPTPYQLDVNTLEAQLANAQASQRELEESVKGAKAKIAETRGAIDQATSRTREVSARLELARKRVAKANGEFAQVAQIRAQLANAKWLLDQTTTVSPCDCYVVNLQLRPGGFVAGIPLNAVMTLVEAEGQVVALYHQNELHQIQPGNEAEFALKTLPGRIIKAKVDSVIWAQGQGQLPVSGTIPLSGFVAQPPGRYAVKFDIADRDKPLFLAAGAAGDAAIYTEHLHAVHIIRKVILRVGSYLNYLILKLH